METSLSHSLREGRQSTTSSMDTGANRPNNTSEFSMNVGDLVSKTACISWMLATRADHEVELWYIILSSVLGIPEISLSPSAISIWPGGVLYWRSQPVSAKPPTISSSLASRARISCLSPSSFPLWPTAPKLHRA
jgi:hypothetical protein